MLLPLCLLCLIVFSLLIRGEQLFPHFVRILHGASGTYLAGEGQEQGG